MLKIQSFSDVITNSSSELFIFDDGQTLEDVIKSLDEVYPDWRSEYKEPIESKDISNEDFKSYFYDDYMSPYEWEVEEAKIVYNRRFHRHKKGAYYNRPNVKRKLLTPYFVNPKHFREKDSYARKFALKYGMTPKECYKDWSTYNPFTKPGDREHHSYLFFTEQAVEVLKKTLKPMVLVCSKEENPHWEFVEKIEEIASERRHLG